MNVLLYRHLHRITDWHRSKMTEAVEDRSRITWVLEVSFLVRREASVSAAATHLRPTPRAARVTKVTSTRIRIFFKPNTFLCELPFRLHEPVNPLTGTELLLNRSTVAFFKAPSTRIRCVDMAQKTWPKPENAHPHEKTLAPRIVVERISPWKLSNCDLSF